MTHEVDRHLFVILGATGDLTRRKLLPSLYRIITENAIGHRCIVMGAATNEMVVVGDIDFWSMCEHHMLPIFGQAHVAYLPDKKVVGLSKITRVVDAFARRLQIQDRMTRQIA